MTRRLVADWLRAEIGYARGEERGARGCGCGLAKGEDWLHSCRREGFTMR
jgi:hypothetical protein